MMKPLKLYPPPVPSTSIFFSLSAIRRQLSAALLFTIAALFLFAFFSLNLSRSAIVSRTDLIHHYSDHRQNLVIREQPPPSSSQPLSISHVISSSAAAVLMPAWEILVIVSPESTPLSDDAYVCAFQNNSTSAARLAGALPLTNRTAFYCRMPNRVKRLRPFLQPVLCLKSQINIPSPDAMAPELLRWKFLVYESISTENDVVLFAKGLNPRQGINRPPSKFKCVFGDPTQNDAVRTTVTSSAQEVFRCPHPDLTPLTNDKASKIKISLEIVDANKPLVAVLVPSVAFYHSPKLGPNVAQPLPKRRRSSSSPVDPTKSAEEEEPGHVLCACTMVYNVAKFLREWVTYHSGLGVDRFVLYDNDSDDGLGDVVKQLNEEGFNVTTTFWVWPKTQEAGFSHAAVYGKSLCKWVMYIDVDEFVYAPSYVAAPEKKHMLKSLLPKDPKIGQVSIRCNEFGPSSQKTHPLEGVTQGYTCRRRLNQRHKSIVKLEAVEYSLFNVIHHFRIKEEFRSESLSIDDAIVNHYKYQAWPEFQTKFRRRVSAYVVDWTQELNPKSKDRTPGLGFQAVEPKGWADMFCEVKDERLKMLTQRWFRTSPNHTDTKMLWQI